MNGDDQRSSFPTNSTQILCQTGNIGKNGFTPFQRLLVARRSNLAGGYKKQNQSVQRQGRGRKDTQPYFCARNKKATKSKHNGMVWHHATMAMQQQLIVFSVFF